MADSKISDLTPFTISTSSGSITLNQLGLNVYFPVYVEANNTKENKRMSILSIFSIILLYVQDTVGTSVDNYLANNPDKVVNIETGGGGGSSGSGDNSNITNLINSLSTRLSTLESSSNWPINYITLTNGTTSIDYPLYSGPGKSGYARGAIVINTSNLLLPNFYVNINVSAPSLSGTTATIPITGSISNNNNNLLLQGGTISTVFISGTLYTSSGNYSFSDLITKNVTLSSSSSLNESVNINIQVTGVTQGASLLKVELTAEVNSKSVPGSASFTVANNAGLGASGFITL